MGLAASQARLLFITNRQNDVSAKMQRISNENLILARDAEDLDAKYKQMKNRETYQVGGVDLSYDLLMGSQAAQNGTLTLLQSRGGAVVLSPSMASNLGLSNPGSSKAFKTKWPDQTKFIAKMTGMDEANVRTILNEINGSNSGNGNSSGSENKLSINSILYGNMSSGTSSKNVKLNDTYYYFKDDDIEKGTDMNSFSAVSYNSKKATQVNSSNALVGIFGNSIDRTNNNGSSVTIESKSQSLYDLYKNAGEFSGVLVLGTSQTNGDPDFSAVSSNFQAFTNNIATMLNTGFSKIKELDSDKIEKVVQTKSSNLIEYYKSHINGEQSAGSLKQSTSDSWFKALSNQNGYGWDDGASEYNENSTAMSMIAAKGYKGIVAARNYGDGNQWIFSIDAGTYVKELMNAVFAELTNNACQSKSADGTQIVTNSTESFTISSKYLASAETETPKTADEIGKANVQFYKNMYNTMEVCGYLVDDKVNTSSYLNEKLQNNQYYVNGNPVENSKTVTKKVDENATKEAKEFYDMEMDKIKRKEKQLDIDLNKLQTEYSALTNDYNSVKGLIDANIQRSFTYCSQG